MLKHPDESTWVDISRFKQIYGASEAEIGVMAAVPGEGGAAFTFVENQCIMVYNLR